LRVIVPQVPLAVNGGIRTLAEAQAALQRFDGIMIGREAYHRPWLLAELDCAREDLATPRVQIVNILEAMREYARREQRAGTRLHAITRHMLGLLAGSPGARDLRHLLSAEVQRGLGPEEVFKRATEIAAQAA
ncbi:MAG TPA: tRNA-dihydrouridine synthase, partial [Steroidobacteraceae bacterium]|nr:tRNA-dihydrouridine synthase [Steroidobacteraceae bacterium]